VLALLQVSFSGNYVRGDNTELRHTPHPLTDEGCVVVAIFGAPQAQIRVREHVVVGLNELHEAREYVRREAEPLQFSVGVLAESRDGCAPAVAQVICTCHVLGGLVVENRIDDEPHEKRGYGRHHAPDGKGGKERGGSEHSPAHERDEPNDEGPSTPLLHGVGDALHTLAALIHAANFAQGWSVFLHNCVGIYVLERREESNLPKHHVR